jgi:FkbM family methyltransferase
VLPNRKFVSPDWYFQKVRLRFAKALLGLGIPLKFTSQIDDFQIQFVTTSLLEYSLRAQKSYTRERVTMGWLRNIVGAGDVVYDIGANVGAYSLYAGKKLKFSTGRVYAFEPAFFNFSALCKNIEVNWLNDIVLPFPVAFTAVSGPDKLFLSSTISGSALHAVGKTESEGKSFAPRFTQGVLSSTIDEFCHSPNVMFPNHIKIDVDGTEGEIIRGMASTIIDPRLKSIMIEIDSDQSQGSIEQLICESEFVLVDEEQWEGKNSHNKLFVREL